MLPTSNPERPTRRLSIYRRRRLIWSLIFFVTSFCFVVYLQLGDQGVTYFLSNWHGNSFPKPIEPIDELKALLYMVTSSEQLLPEDYDVKATPLDLSVITDGETLSKSDWMKRFDAMEKFNPLIVFSKTYCPYSHKAKRLLETYDLHPSPRIIEVDLRPDADIIKALLTRLTFHSTFPNIILQSKSLGGSDDLQRLHESGQLRGVLEKAGLSVSAEGDPAAVVVNKLSNDQTRRRSS